LSTINSGERRRAAHSLQTNSSCWSRRFHPARAPAPPTERPLNSFFGETKSFAQTFPEGAFKPAENRERIAQLLTSVALQIAKEFSTMAVRTRCGKRSPSFRPEPVAPGAVRPRPAALPRGLALLVPAGLAGAVAAVLVLATIAWLVLHRHPRNAPEPLASAPPEATEPARAEPVTEPAAPAPVPPVQPAPVHQRPESPPQPEIVFERPPAPAPGGPAPKPLKPFKRRGQATEAELSNQLLVVPEVSLASLSLTPEQLETTILKTSTAGGRSQGPPVLVTRRAEFHGLPFRTNGSCLLDRTSAETLDRLATKLHGVLDGAPDEEQAAAVRKALLVEGRAEWLRGEAVPCLVQMLQARPAAVRKVLVDALAQIDDRRATRALARRALVDLHPLLREAAARALAGRPREDYAPVLLTGLRYPWSPLATHAAEALVFLDDQPAVQQLEALLRQPDPRLPFVVRQDGKETVAVREVVRISHQNNCMLCHPPTSTGEELVRGWVPGSERAPRPGRRAFGFGGYGLGAMIEQTAVHADTTYLKQDFSVLQPADRDGKASAQRFDYLVRVRRATPQEIQSAAELKAVRPPTEVQEALLFALRELTGKDHRLDGQAPAAAPEVR
jgi:hypothetical protein